MAQSWEKTFLSDNTSHNDWIRKNSTKYSKAQMAETLGRSVDSIDSKLRREGLLCADDNVVQVGTEAEETVEGISIDALLKAIKDKPQTLLELSHTFDRSPDTMRKAIEQLMERSYEISQTEGQRHVWSTKIPKIVAPPTILWDKDTWEFRLGVMSDWHDGSKSAQISARNKAIETMYDEGVRDIIVAGDINTGYDVYQGQELDIVSPRPDDQIAITETYCPRYDDLRYHLMGGNHDYDFIKHGGHNALKRLCERRDDFLYYGYDLVTVPLTESVDALVWHGSRGQAYAMSYKSQKFLEQVAFEQLMEVVKNNIAPKVRFLFVGHWHSILMGYWKGPIYVQHTGGFEGQTNLSKRMGVFPELSAVILEGKITKDKNIIRDLSVRYLRFTEIVDDFLSYSIPRQQEETHETLFQWNSD